MLFCIKGIFTPSVLTPIALSRSQNKFEEAGSKNSVFQLLSDYVQRHNEITGIQMKVKTRSESLLVRHSIGTYDC